VAEPVKNPNPNIKMELEFVPLRNIKIGETYTHYNRNCYDRGSHTVKISEIWNFMEGAYIGLAMKEQISR